MGWLAPRYWGLLIAVIGLAVCLWQWPQGWDWRAAALVFAAALALGISDLRSKRHSLLRNYPIFGHLRRMFESVRPMLRQYLVEGDQEEVPFSFEQRSIVYQRAKQQRETRPFGTELGVYADGYEWINHSMRPSEPYSHDFRVPVGGPQCAKPYSASVFNISAMSFGSLSPNAIHALNEGARRGGFYHDTGEGSISPYHREGGGDLVWELGSGYFGACEKAGVFSAEALAAYAQAVGRGARSGQDDRDQALAGCQARAWRCLAGGQGERGNCAHPRRPHGRRLHLACPPFGFRYARGSAAFRGTTA